MASLLFYIIFAIGFWISNVHSGPSNDFTFTPTGSLKQLEFFTGKVINNRDEASSFAFVYNNISVIVGLRKYDPLLHDSEGIIRRTHLLCSMVGWNADCIVAWRKIKQFQLEHYSQYKEKMSPGELALSLADEAQVRSMDGNTRPLAFHTLIIGDSKVKHRPPELYKVDITGNYWKCQAAAIGKHSTDIESWVRQKGLDLVANKQRPIPFEEVDPVDDLRFCLDFAWSCVSDVLGDRILRYVTDISILEKGSIIGYVL